MQDGRKRSRTVGIGNLLGFVALMLMALSASGCDWLSGSKTKVYVSGYYGNGTSDNVACYWENGTRHDLPSAGFAAEAASIFLAGDSILVAGSYKDLSNIHYACEWRDGVKTNLPAPVASDDVRAVSVFGYGSDTYYAGFYYNNSLGRFVACYWKNGATTSLAAPGTDFAKASGIHFDGSTLRVAGFHAAANETACLWTNDAMVDLPVPGTATKSNAYSVHVMDGHVFVSGYYKVGTINTACIWIDGARTDLSAGLEGSAGSVFSGGGVTYAAGYAKDGAMPSASLWTAGTQEFLPAVAGHLSGASGVVEYDGSTYVSGYYGNASNVAVACYWLDGSRKDLPSEGLPAFATSVFVK